MPERYSYSGGVVPSEYQKNKGLLSLGPGEKQADSKRVPSGYYERNTRGPGEYQASTKRVHARQFEVISEAQAAVGTSNLRSTRHPSIRQTVATPSSSQHVVGCRDDHDQDNDLDRSRPL